MEYLSLILDNFEIIEYNHIQHDHESTDEIMKNYNLSSRDFEMPYVAHDDSEESDETEED